MSRKAIMSRKQKKVREDLSPCVCKRVHPRFLRCSYCQSLGAQRLDSLSDCGVDSVVWYLPVCGSRHSLTSKRHKKAAAAATATTSTSTSTTTTTTTTTTNFTCFGQTYCPPSGILILYSQQMVFVILAMGLCYPLGFHLNLASRQST